MKIGTKVKWEAKGRKGKITQTGEVKANVAANKNAREVFLEKCADAPRSALKINPNQYVQDRPRLLVKLENGNYVCPPTATVSEV